MRRLLTLFVALAAVLLGACGKNNSSTPPAQVRFFHGVSDSTALTIKLNNDTAEFQSAFGFENLTAYKTLSAASQEIKAFNSSAVSQFDQTYGFSGDNKYTLLFYGRAASTGALFLADSVANPASGNFKIRMANLGNTVADLYVMPSTTNVTQSTANLVGIGVGTSSIFFELAKGDYRIVLTAQGTKDVLYDSGVKTYADQDIVTFVAYGTGSSKLVNGAIISGTSLTVPPNPSARIKAVQATPDVALMDVLVDGVVNFSNVPYKGVSSYTSVASGARNIKIQATNTPGTFQANTNVTLGGGKDYTLVAAGNGGIVTVVPLVDTNFAPTSGKARVRVVNAAIGGGAIDVLVNFTKQLSTIGLNTGSSYLDLDANTYAFTFTTAGTTAAVLSLPSVTLDLATRYTIYVVGTSPNLQGVVSVDN
jgi:hypothetical protein